MPSPHQVENQIRERMYLEGRPLLERGGGAECFTAFDHLPATAVAAGADLLMIRSGTGTEVIARPDKGGVNCKTQATTPADGDNVLLVANAASNLIVPIRADARVRFSTQIALTAITTCFASFGLNENLTDVDPTGTAGDGAMFLFDPTAEVTTGLTTAQHANWILAHKVNGVDTFDATDIPVVAGQDYQLSIDISSQRKAHFYIDGRLVGVGPALTSGDSVGAFCGIELTATPGGQRDFDCRFVRVARKFL